MESKESCIYRKRPDLPLPWEGYVTYGMQDTPNPLLWIHALNSLESICSTHKQDPDKIESFIRIVRLWKGQMKEQYNICSPLKYFDQIYSNVHVGDLLGKYRKGIETILNQIRKRDCKALNYISTDIDKYRQEKETNDEFIMLSEEKQKSNIIEKIVYTWLDNIWEYIQPWNDMICSIDILLEESEPTYSRLLQVINRNRHKLIPISDEIYGNTYMFGSLTEVMNCILLEEIIKLTNKKA